MLLIDAHTGKASIFMPPAGATWLGVNKSGSQVQSQFPQVNWTGNKTLEPRPVVHNGKLYWMHTITNNDNANSSSTTLIDVVTREVKVFCSVEDLKRFLKDQFSGYTTICSNLQQSTTAQQPQSVQTPVPTQPTTPPPAESDFHQLTDEQLYERLQRNTAEDTQIVNELRRRHEVVPTPSR